VSLRFIALASGSSGNAYVLEDSGASLGIEAGLPIAKYKSALWSRGLWLAKLSGVLISHEHGDHAQGVPKLIKEGVTCWMSEHTGRALRVYDAPFNTARVLCDGDRHCIGEFCVRPFYLKHGTDSCLGFYVVGPSGESLWYATDFVLSEYRIPPRTTILALACNHDPNIVLERVKNGNLNAQVAERSITSHPNIDMVCGLLDANRKNLRNCREIHLLHVSAGNGNAPEFVRRVTALTGIPTQVHL
jgi:Beta-lactamase superfamily domain